MAVALSRPAVTIVWSAAVLLLGACGKSPSLAKVSDATNEGPASASLKATDGTTIQIAADIMENEDPGLHLERNATSIQIAVANPRLAGDAQVRAVLIDLCGDDADPGDTYPEAVQCDLRLSAGAYRADVGQGCDLEGHDADFTLYSSTAGGSTTTCTQQIAVVVNGTWLTDPVNRSHNFNFSL